jgi:hypothetical protein
MEKNMKNSLIFIERRITLSKLKSLLEKHFDNPKIKKLGQVPLWIFIVLLFEIMGLLFFRNNPFIPYMYIIFSTTLILWFSWDCYKYSKIRELAICEFIIELSENSE